MWLGIYKPTMNDNDDDEGIASSKEVLFSFFFLHDSDDDRHALATPVSLLFSSSLSSISASSTGIGSYRMLLHVFAVHRKEIHTAQRRGRGRGRGGE